MNRLFVDSLTVIDFSQLHSERGLIGESLIVDITLTGELDEMGMLFDFGEVKKQIKGIIDQEADHKLIVPGHLSELSISHKGHEINLFHNEPNKKFLFYHGPESSVLVLNEPEITPQNLSQHLEKLILKQLPDNVSAISILLQPENLTTPFYHYSHGLKKHKGNCQRIAHGHRSKIEIWENGISSPALEQQWATKFSDIYIATEEDNVSNDNLPSELSLAGDDILYFQYSAPQGNFKLALHKNEVYQINTDSTVEWIASHIAKSLKHQYPASTFVVKAYEGVGKGAIAER